MVDKLLGMLGLARRAGRLSSGHDASFESIRKGKAKACLLCGDASDRLKEEFGRTAKYEGRDVPVIEIPYLKYDLYAATGIRAAVLTIDDEGFAKKIISLAEELLNGN